MELSASLLKVLSEPRYEAIRHTFDKDLVLTKSGHLATGLARSLFAALNDTITELFVEGVTIKSVFETIKDKFELPECISLRQFYRYRASFKNNKKSQQTNSYQEKNLSFVKTNGFNFGGSRGGDLSSTASSCTFLNNGLSGIQPVARPQSLSAGPVIITREPSEQAAVWDHMAARQLVPFNEGALVKVEVEKQGGVWPKRAGTASMIVLPGKVSNCAQAREFWSHVSSGLLPVPENLYPLKPDDPLYPFEAKTVLDKDREDGFTFLIDDDGFVYDPLLVSRSSFGIPVPIPKWLMFYPKMSCYKDLRQGYGDYVNRWQPRIVSEILSFYPDIHSFINIKSLDEFVNVKRGVFEMKPMAFRV